MTRDRVLAVAAALIVAGALPLLISDYRTFQLTLALVYAIAILGLNILTGYNGQVSLGHGAFYALGAYTAAVMITQDGVAWYWTMPVAGAIGFESEKKVSGTFSVTVRMPSAGRPVWSV